MPPTRFNATGIVITHADKSLALIGFRPEVLVLVFSYVTMGPRDETLISRGTPGIVCGVIDDGADNDEDDDGVAATKVPPLLL